jgi:hypothetical protein
VVSELFERLLPLLVDETLAQVRALSLDGPLARLKLWYYDTHAPACYFLAHGITQRERQRMLDNDGREALYQIWDGTGSIEFEIGLSGASRPLLEQVYERMAYDPDEGGELQEGEYGESLSGVLAQMFARRLNEIDWAQYCAVTDDFIVYSQNGTDYGCYCYEDLCASVPTEKLDLLRSRRLMGPGEQYAYLPNT